MDPSSAAVHSDYITQARVKAEEYEIELGYWDTRAFGEPIRLLLHHLDINYTDKRWTQGMPPTYSKQQWNEYKTQLQTHCPFPNLPYLIQTHTHVANTTDCGTAKPLVLSQFRSILRHICRTFAPCLLGTSDYEMMLADSITEGLMDSWSCMFALTYCDWNFSDPAAAVRDSECHREGQTQCLPTSNFEKQLQRYSTSTLVTNLQQLCDIFRSTGSQCRWVCGDHLTYADFILFEYLDTHTYLVPGCLTPYPELTSFHKSFSQLHGISEYHTSERFKVEPFHSRYSHFHEGWSNRK
eukprot:GFYU01017806.1.p1 GENE.GFYU01017806.1~~GFYU01017806.1.p1  ORF type:complete len:296 (-),score=58.27 GFYU01017806.1:17-904(-)